ncbi:YbeD family protein [Oceanobacter mangrovi]|uniref:YbeD family protein n=1 Tax=Oceanobacter mangrovi TaxID=2862510 RepID=UPI001C8D3170|nr:DUF493 domain-containing protein [Oceanobacter mangrovi]
MALIGADGKQVTEQEAPKIEFPCANYPVKVVGKGTEDFREVMLSIFEVHAPGFDYARVMMRDSSKGNFRSMTVYITATGVDQLQALHKDLTAHQLVHMVI